jgi:hypothetical protein
VNPPSTVTTDLVLRCLTKSIPVVDHQPKSSLIISPNLTRSITSLVDKYGNAIIALQLAALVNGLGRDNRCLSMHLTNPKDCPDAPPFIRNEARKGLSRKMLPFSDLGGIQGVKRCNLTVRTLRYPRQTAKQLFLSHLPTCTHCQQACSTKTRPYACSQSW